MSSSCARWTAPLAQSAYVLILLPDDLKIGETRQRFAANREGGTDGCKLILTLGPAHCESRARRADTGTWSSEFWTG